MKIVSVNVGLPREVKWHGRMVTTGYRRLAGRGHIQRYQTWCAVFGYAACG
jgi:hypothetical protein